MAVTLSQAYTCTNFASKYISVVNKKNFNEKLSCILLLLHLFVNVYFMALYNG